MQQDQQTQWAWWSKMVIYWLDSHVALTFHSNLPPGVGKDAILRSLRLDHFNQFLMMRGYRLRSFTTKNVPQAMNPQGPNTSTDNVEHISGQDQETADLYAPHGKHIFQHPSGRGSLVTCFFTIEQIMPYSTAGTTVMGNAMGPMYTASAMSGMGGYGSDTTRTVINLINSARNDLLNDAQASIVAASPNWLCGATPVTGGCGTHGCPIVPPIPVLDPPATWRISLPDLPSNLQDRTGSGVTVFVLDTRPELEQVTKAAQLAGNNNVLLKTLVNQMYEPQPLFVFNGDTSLPPVLEDGDPMQPFTGRDIFGRLAGFEMSDHGLFVSGIIRDIVPEARIECIRALNDFGVGTISVLMEALEHIHNRMLPLNPDTNQAGDLYQRPVAVNLSLVTLPHQEEIAALWGSDPSAWAQIETLKVNLQGVIQSLTSLGAVIVGAAGNDSDKREARPLLHPRSWNVTTERMLPRYPAAFPEVISVGAVDNTDHAAIYSNYPVSPGSAQNNAVATYGGGVPLPVFPATPPPVASENTGSTVNHDEDCPLFNSDTMVGVDSSHIDALAGIYTACCYPALSADDPQHEYKAPNNNAWAYWSGTSFATPIISAIAARVLEHLAANPHLQPYQWHSEVMRVLTGVHPLSFHKGNTATTEHTVPEFSIGGVHVGLIRARQMAFSALKTADTQKEENIAVG